MDINERYSLYHNAIFDYENGITYAIIDNGKHLKIIDYDGSIQDVNLVIPEEYKGIPVTEIGSFAFYGVSSFKSITIPDSIVKIEQKAFYLDDSPQLAYTEYGNCCYIGNKTNPYKYLFKSIRQETEATSVTNYSIHEKTQFIGEGAFYENEEVVDIYIPDNVLSVGYDCFDSCKNLVSVRLPNNLSEISHYCFYECTKLSDCKIPNSVKYIGEWAFYGCESLTGTLKIGNNVKCIGHEAFLQTGYDSVELTDNLIYLFSGSFDKALLKRQCIYYKNGYYLGTKTNPYRFFMYANGVEDYWGVGEFEINENTKVIAGYAFESCRCFQEEEFYIPDSVEYICKDAFLGFGDPRKIKFGKNLKYVGYDAFDWCKAEEIEFPDYGVAYSTNCFAGASLRGEVRVPKIIKDTSGCFEFEKKFYDFLKVSNVLEPVEGEGMFGTCEEITRAVFSDDTERIYPGMFMECVNLSEIVFPSNLKSIDDSAFNSCVSLSEFSLPETLESIGDFSFNGCDGLSEISLGDKIKYLGHEAFQYCTSLTQVTIPGNLGIIQGYTFYGCSGLTTVEILEGVKEIEENAFAVCANIQHFSIPNSIEFLPDMVMAIFSDGSGVMPPIELYRDEFGNGYLGNSHNHYLVCVVCENGDYGNIKFFKDGVKFINAMLPYNFLCVEFPESTESIFIDSKPFKTIILNKNVKKFGLLGSSFSGNIISYSETPPIVNLQTNNPSKIFVPTCSEDAYKTAMGWGAYYGNIKGKSDLWFSFYNFKIVFDAYNQMENQE